MRDSKFLSDPFMPFNSSSSFSILPCCCSAAETSSIARTEVVPARAVWFARKMPNSVAVPLCTASPLVVGQAHKIVDFLLGLLASVTISLLKLADELLSVALDLVDVVLRQLSPPASDVSSYLKPFAFENILVHRIPPLVL